MTAYRLNESLLDVRVNPLILDSGLVDLALIELYPDEHRSGHSSSSRPRKVTFAPRSGPAGAPEAPSEIAEPEEIVTPAPPVTEPPSPPPADPQQ